MPPPALLLAAAAGSSLRGAQRSDWNCTSSPACNTCKECCENYIPKGPQCDACVKEHCYIPVCSSNRTECNTCAACCEDYISPGEACASCAKEHCTATPSPPGPSPPDAPTPSPPVSSPCEAGAPSPGVADGSLDPIQGPWCASASAAWPVEQQIHHCAVQVLQCNASGPLPAPIVRCSGAQCKAYLLRIGLGAANLSATTDYGVASRALLQGPLLDFDEGDLRETVCGCSGAVPRWLCSSCNTQSAQLGDACRIPSAYNPKTDATLPGVNWIRSGYVLNGQPPFEQGQNGRSVFSIKYKDSPQYRTTPNDGEKSYIAPYTLVDAAPGFRHQCEEKSDIFMTTTAFSTSTLTAQSYASASANSQSKGSNAGFTFNGMSMGDASDLMGMIKDCEECAALLVAEASAADVRGDEPLFSIGSSDATGNAMMFSQSQATVDMDAQAKAASSKTIVSKTGGTLYTLKLKESMSWDSYDPCFKRDLTWVMVMGYRFDHTQEFLRMYGHYVLEDSRIGALVQAHGVAQMNIDMESVDELSSQVSNHMSSATEHHDSRGSFLGFHWGSESSKASADAASKKHVGHFDNRSELVNWQESLTVTKFGSQKNCIGDTDSETVIGYSARPLYDLQLRVVGALATSNVSVTDVLKANVLVNFLQGRNCSKATLGVSDWQQLGVCAWDGKEWVPKRMFCNDSHVWDADQKRCAPQTTPANETTPAPPGPATFEMLVETGVTYAADDAATVNVDTWDDCVDTWRTKYPSSPAVTFFPKEVGKWADTCFIHADTNGWSRGGSAAEAISAIHLPPGYAEQDVSYQSKGIEAAGALSLGACFAEFAKNPGAKTMTFWPEEVGVWKSSCFLQDDQGRSPNVQGAYSYVRSTSAAPPTPAPSPCPQPSGSYPGTCKDCSITNCVLLCSCEGSGGTSYDDARCDLRFCSVLDNFQGGFVCTVPGGTFPGPQCPHIVG